MAYVKNEVPVFGTTFFDGAMARKGYGLNKMCYTFNEASAREEFFKDEMAYCDRFGLTEAQKKAVHDRDVLKLIEEGGNIYYLAKFAGLLGMNMQDIGALQTGMSLEAFKQKLVDAGR
ncbi:protocatechuate 4,5-dioxygenase subunit alpha [Vibrio ziniensis]|uniref:Protocatechuate 4,5-dioxygenase subunit alpha n=1 Tax=Vibrio ziniensis TaxID=2711221 RepID=A0A6G7CQ42_9VIBR|nr:protocatechuate 4,5-dioxygenase subunit alpha [Vibrio ziniensis]QIH44271.1 protocatechuate 4,5-dioxygenase subunit alpha [Vibrio ziniensis]